MPQKKKLVVTSKTTKLKKKQPPVKKPSVAEKKLLTANNVTLNADHSTDSHASFPIVGIGASAGGLELFLANVPTDSGMAFVIIQHLVPTHKGNHGI